MRFRKHARNVAATVLRAFPFPGRFGVLEIIESILGPNPGTFEVPLRGGGKLLVDGVRDMQIFYLGEFQWNVHSFLCRNCREGQTVFDVGANIGAYTIPMALRVGSSGRVYAFEAFRPNYEILLKNIALNGLTNVIPVFGAVADYSGSWDAPQVGERSSFIGNYSLASDSQSRTRIPAWSLDDFVAERCIDRIDLMKIDIEGSEVLALKGARATFSQRKVKTVVCEMNPYWLKLMGSSMQELCGIFEASGFEAFLLTRYSRLRPIDEEFCLRATSDFDAVYLRG